MVITTASKKIDLVRSTGLSHEGGQSVALDSDNLRQILGVKLAAHGFEVPGSTESEDGNDVLSVAKDLFRVYREQSRLLDSHLCPIDARVQNFLDDALKSLGETERVELPKATLGLDRYGLARELSFPENCNEFHNSEIDSYRLSKNSVLHNPINDKRTTQGVFHVADYGLPVPADKIAVPLIAYARLLKTAFQPPSELNRIPYTTTWAKPAESLVSLQLRPLVCPEVPGVYSEKRSEVRFIVPGGCCSNLDFVESIFGNAGDPSLPENDAGLDTDHWTGTTGCVILAPHLRQCKKKYLGLPNVADATDDQIAKGICWSDPNELYNSGKPFKITLRDGRGIMVTILADNYFGKIKRLIQKLCFVQTSLFLSFHDIFNDRILQKRS